MLTPLETAKEAGVPREEADEVILQRDNDNHNVGK